VTDSGSEVRYDEAEKPGVANLMSIYRCFTGKTFEEIEAEFAGRGYGDFKTAVGEATADALAPVRDEFARLMADKGYLESVMREGAEQANYAARKTLSKIKRKLGFVTL
jgi:tryptophanyl-tRNA synthetase